MTNIIDPRKLPPNFYLISKSGVDVVSALIQWWTGLWNHSMLMRNPGKVVWQGIQIVEKPIDFYMKKDTRMDFFTIKNLPPNALIAMNKYINHRMSGPWYSQTYDFIGILGQILKQPWIHTPGLDYCSVFELAVLRSGAPFMPSEMANPIMAMAQESNPQQMHDFYVAHSDIFNYEGAYESDEGVIV
jgi:hypothetical protein